MINWAFEEYQLDEVVGSEHALVESKHPQLHPGAKPLVRLYYFDTFETYYI